MNLGKLCKYAKGCSVYQNTNSEQKKPVFLVRNVFCNRGSKGWYNCLRFLKYEEGIGVREEMTPYG